MISDATDFDRNKYTSFGIHELILLSARNLEISIVFFKKVQNKIHYAIHGQTAVEVIYTRADAEKELRAMGQLVSGYLDFAERQAEREQAVDKATGEYKKYKERTLSSVGEDYLNSIKILEKKTEKKQ